MNRVLKDKLVDTLAHDKLRESRDSLFDRLAVIRRPVNRKQTTSPKEKAK